MQFLVISLLVAVAFASPVPEVKKVDSKSQVREKRSSYAPVTYSAPCGAGIPSLQSLQAPPHLVQAQPYQLTSLPSYYNSPHASGYSGYSAPHYRSDEHVMMTEDGEMMSFSDMGHMPMARSYDYGDLGGHVLSSPASSYGQALGVFPHARAGGCAVPLLLTCSPSIVQGQMLHSPSSYTAHSEGGAAVLSGADVQAYRGVDDHQMHKESMEDSHVDSHMHSAQDQHLTTHENSNLKHFQ